MAEPPDPLDPPEPADSAANGPTTNRWDRRYRVAGDPLEALKLVLAGKRRPPRPSP